MWGWLLLGWFGASIVFAVMHHRMRSAQPQVGSAARTVLARFESVLRREHPDVGFKGMVPGEMVAILDVDGQETPVPLRTVIRHAEAFPDSLPSLVDQLLEEVREAAIERHDDYAFADVATDLMPQVRPREWVEQKGRFGDAALVTRPLTDELSIAYVIDGDSCMTFVCRAHLRFWGRSEADVHNLALQNLRRRTGDVGVPSSGPLVFRLGDGYDAARMLLLDPERCEGLLVAAPDRDLLWVGEPGEATVASLMASSGELIGDHPVHGSVLKVERGAFVDAGRDE
jgi:uncharacterized protein YtpQ (UPF0354 family)